MTASHPDRPAPQEPAQELSGKHAAGSDDKPRSTPRSRSASSPLERARAAARKLLGRDRDKAKKEDPNIYPLF